MLNQALFFEGSENVAGERIGGDLLQFVLPGRRRNFGVQARLAHVSILSEGSVLDGKAEAHAQTNHAQNARWIVIKRVVADGTQFPPAQIAETVGGIEQQSPRCFSERERDGV